MIIQNDTFLIRPIDATELPTVLDIYRQCEDFLELTPKPIASMEIVLDDMALSQQNKGAFCGIYDASQHMIGIVDVVLNGFEGDYTTAFIELLMIAKPYRTKGLGSKVVKAIEAQIVCDPAIKSIVLAVMVNNPTAILFWQRQGYNTFAGPLPEPDGTTVWRMAKSVSVAQE